MGQVNREQDSREPSVKEDETAQEGSQRQPEYEEMDLKLGIKQEDATFKGRKRDANVYEYDPAHFKLRAPTKQQPLKSSAKSVDHYDTPSSVAARAHAPVEHKPRMKLSGDDDDDADDYVEPTYYNVSF